MGQDLEICLLSPQQMGYLPSSEWHVESFGNFLEIVDVTDGMIYVSMKDNIPRRWRELSTLFLGNIVISVKSKEKGVISYEEHANVHVFMKIGWKINEIVVENKGSTMVNKPGILG